MLTHYNQPWTGHPDYTPARETVLSEIRAISERLRELEQAVQRL
jgi:hypothetical protein